MAALSVVLACSAVSDVSAQALDFQKKPAQKLSTTPERLELGWLLPTAKKQGTVTLTNTSDEVIEILRVTSSCTCTVGELRDDQRVLEPGDSTDLSITLKGGPNTGPLVQRAYVHYKGSSTPYEVIVSADVSLAVKTDPTFVNLLGTSKTGKIKLESLDGMPFRVTSVDGKEPKVFSIDGEELDASKAAMAFLVEFDYTGIADDDLDRWFMIETDHPEAAPELPLRVLHTSLYQMTAGNAKPSWSFVKDRVILGRMEPGDEVTKVVELKPVSSPEAVTAVSINNAGLDAEILETKAEGRNVLVKLRIVATGGASGLIKARLSLTADGETHEADIIARVEDAS